MAKTLSIHYELEQLDEAKNEFEKLKKSGKYNQLFLVESHHEYSHGVWIEEKTPKLSYADYILKEFKLGR